jgi:DNA-binding MarR family transcriptional regulator
MMESMTDDDTPWYDEMVMPVLLDMARRRYGDAIRGALTEAGYSDIPRRGARVIGGIARNGRIRQEDLPQAVGGTKQGVSQLIDTCVTRGYLQRVPDSDDRRRMIISLTERGEDAAAVVRGTVESVDAAVVAALGADGVASLRSTLATIVEIELAPAAAS